jgi:hypothetical protein
LLQERAAHGGSFEILHTHATRTHVAQQRPKLSLHEVLRPVREALVGEFLAKEGVVQIGDRPADRPDVVAQAAQVDRLVLQLVDELVEVLARGFRRLSP